MRACDESKPYIFVSYAHRDSGAVLPIIETLSENGYNVWYDDGIEPGSEWDENIASHIDQCSYFIAFISKAYMESENCKDELNYARDLEKENLLVYLEDVQLSGGMAMRMNRLQAIMWHQFDGNQEDKAYRKLFSARGIDKVKVFAVGDSKTECEEPQAEKTILAAEECEPVVRNAKRKSYVPFYIIGGSAALLLVVAIVCIVIVFVGKAESETSYDKGVAYLYGNEDTQIDYLQAYEYLSEAAGQGDAQAMRELGYMYENGCGVNSDYLSALEWYEKAAECGDAGAIYSIGRFYNQGYVVARNTEKALEWYDLSYRTGNAEAAYAMGVIYETGDGVATDYHKALEYYAKAAEGNYAPAFCKIGIFYYYGYGVKVDLEKAKQWFAKGAQEGEPEAIRWYEELSNGE